MVGLTLPLGKLEGLQHKSHQAWLGIPFAQPPVNELRFKAPQPVKPWPGIRSATKFGNSCPQGTHPVPGMAASGPRDEDCLYLNIYTPAADQQKRAVLFWIHGGAFLLGSGSEQLYDGGKLAERGDVVVVTVHYRVAALGYACFGSDSLEWGASANLGQLDQIAALRWVREHIHHFGGDAGNVTIFGESAGSAAVGTLLAMPSAKGLFHKAIMQSGAPRAADFQQASKLGYQLLDKLGIQPGDATALQSVGVDNIVEAAIALATPGGISFGPVEDGITLPHAPEQANAAGFSASIPLLIGTNRDEWKLFNNVANRKPIDDDQLIRRTSRLLGIDESAASELVEVYRHSRQSHGLTAQNLDIFDTIESVWRMRSPCSMFAIDHSQHQTDTWHYLFCYESPARHGILGSCHALEIPFVFGTLDAPTQDRFAGTGPVVEELSANMMDAWISFARNGSPEHAGIGKWPRYEASLRSTMIFDSNCHPENDPFAAERIAMEKVLQSR